MRTPTAQLCQQFMQNFEGQTWYGECLLESLERISTEEALHSIAGRSIMRLTRHLLAWRVFALEKLKNNETFDIALNSEADWPSDESAPSWEEVLSELKGNQAQMLASIEKMSAEKLLEKVPGRPYRYAFLLQGILEHDAYHQGQINLLYQLVKA
jgi:uncharacterized damage-inducible protein DinB